MEFSLSDVLHVVGQAVLIPCMTILCVLLLVAVWQTGDLLVELFTERRKMRGDVPALLERIHEGGADEIASVIQNSYLLSRFKRVILRLVEAGDLPKASLTALAQRLLATEEDDYARHTLAVDIGAKVGPMFGLLGTLIPLGPGIIALGSGDTATLAQSMGIAFDTTIAGLISAAVCSVISMIRKRWYNDYMVTMESIMECVLEEVSQCSEAQDWERPAACVGAGRR